MFSVVIPTPHPRLLDPSVKLCGHLGGEQQRPCEVFAVCLVPLHAWGPWRGLCQGLVGEVAEGVPCTLGLVSALCFVFFQAEV